MQVHLIIPPLREEIDRKDMQIPTVLEVPSMRFEGQK